ncbi:2,3-bisphosphoglycerate-dependent phosphoglycerate mutase [Alkalibacillus almallahensis]|nr:2,3-bisphosphoglycerate-dependent phosphoglycerate mutase [Alkalibacillus almallahensis]
MNDKEIDLIVSSPYTRAIQTIEGIASNKNIDIKVFEALKERKLKGSYKLPEVERKQSIKKSYENYDYSLTGGESVKDVQHRALPIIKDLLYEHKGKSIIIGTHGNVMTIIINYFNQDYGYDFWKNTSKPDIYKLGFLGTELQFVHRLWD